MWELGTHGSWTLYTEPSYDGIIKIFVEVESLCGATGYSLRTPRLEVTVLDGHIREPTMVITEKPGHNQKPALFISEIRVERSHSIFCTNCHKIDTTTGYCSWVKIHPYKKKQRNLVCFTDTCFSPRLRDSCRVLGFRSDTP